MRHLGRGSLLCFSFFFFFFLAYGSSIAPASFVQKVIFPLLNCFCTFVKNHFSIFVWVCFWALCSVPLIYVSVLSPIPRCLDYCTSSLLFFYCYSPPMVLYIKYPGWRSHMLLTERRKLSQQPGHSLWALLWPGLSTDWTEVGAMPAKPPLVWNCLLQA